MASKKNSNNKRKKSLIKKQFGGSLTGEQILMLGINNQLNLDKYVLLSCREFNPLAHSLIQKSPNLFIKGNLSWKEYADATPKMFIDEYTVKMLKGRHVIYLAYFSFNESESTNILSQYMFLSSLASYGIEKLHIVLPYYPTGTMERIQKEGELGTGYYLAQFFNTIPCGNSKNELYVIDMHALCTRFFFHTNIKMTFITMFNMYANIIIETGLPSFVVFPDDGAEKRNSELCKLAGISSITCAKKRTESDRFITIKGSLNEVLTSLLLNLQVKRNEQPVTVTNLYIMDDLIQTGGTAGKVIEELDTTLKHELNTKLQTQQADTVSADEWNDILKYILLITHSILPPPLDPHLEISTSPNIDSVKKIFMEGLHFGKMQNIQYVTTDTRPFMEKILIDLNSERDSPLYNKIRIIPIADILFSVFTDINTRYITPFKQLV